MKPLPEGTRLITGYFDLAQQRELIDQIRKITARAPLFVPKMPKTGKPMSVRMTNCGPLGWVTDKENGYRYQAMHPVTGNPWPEMPKLLIDLWSDVSGYDKPAEACLINYYEPEARMGLHQDKDELDLDAPVISVSLGDSCLFRLGGQDRRDKTQSFKLESGDVFLLSGAARLAYHGVDRIYPDTSMLLKQPGRINLTLRRVNR